MRIEDYGLRIGNLGFQSPEGIADFRVEWRWMGQSPKEYVVRSSDRNSRIKRPSTGLKPALRT